MNGTEIFSRTLSYERDLSQIRLRPPAWKLLLAFDGNRTVSEVSLSIGMPIQEITPLTEEFTQKGWIEEQALTLDQYLKSNGTGTFAPPPQPVLDLPPAPVPPPVPPAVPVLKEPPITLLPPPEIVAAPAPPEPVAPTPAPAPKPVKPVIPPRPASVVPPPKILSAAAPAPKTESPFVLTPKAPVTPPPRQKEKLRVQALIDFLVSLGETKILGQLLVYRILVRVPSELLDNANVATLQLANDPTLIADEALQQAIVRAVYDTVNRPLPDGIFVAA